MAANRTFRKSSTLLTMSAHRGNVDLPVALAQAG
jgi:hypothetical protein